MKHLTILLLIAMSFQLFGTDTLRLSIDNPAPRVGDKVEISFDVSFLSEDIEGQIDSSIQISNTSYFLGSDYKKTISFPRSGIYTVGPFKFEFNGKTFVTDSIQLNVADELPLEEGIWVRVVEQNGIQYVIIEQMIENKSDISKKKGQTSYTVGGSKPKGKDFAELEEDTDEGVQFSFRRSHTTTRLAEDSDFNSSGFSYSIRKYEITFDDDFEGSFVLTKKQFINVTRKMKFNDILISK